MLQPRLKRVEPLESLELPQFVLSVQTGAVHSCFRGFLIEKF